jgi:WD40 repeat protein
VRIWDSSSGQPIGEGLAGHQGEVFCVTFSNDGKILASGDAKGVVILWDVSTRQPLGQPITGHPGIVYSLAFSPDSSLLAVGTFNLEDFKGEFGGEIHLWNVVTHERIGEPIKGHAGAIDTLAFSPDGKTLASGSFAQSYVGVAVILWDVATHRPVGSPMKGHTGGILSLAFSPDGKVLASGSEDNTLRLWDVAGRKPLANYDLVNARNPHKSEVLSVQFMRDGKTLISADSGNHILIQELEFSPAGEKELSLYNSTLKKSISGSTRAKMQSLAFSPQTLMWATGACRRVGSEGTCVEGELSTWSIAARLPISHPINEIDESFASLPSLTLSPNGETLGYGGCGEVDGESRKCIRGEVHLWNTATRQLIHQLKDVPGRVTSLAYSPDGKLLAVGSCTRVESLCKGNIRLWSPDTQQFISQSLAGHRRSVNMLAFSRDGKILASSDGEDLILWNIETRQALGEIAPGHKSKQENMVNLVTSIAFSADGKTLASSGCGKIERRVIAETPPTDVCTEGEIRLWDVKTRQLLGKPFAGHTDVITDVAFSPDGKMLASVSGPFDGTIQLWDIATRQPLGAFTGYVTLMSNVMFSPDGKTLVSLSHPSRREGPSTDTICLWDVATRQLIGQPIAGPDNFIYDIAYSFDGRKLVSFGSGRVLLLWDMDLDSWMAGACRIANRNLNSAEWERYFPNQPYHQTCPNFSTPGRN